MKAIKNISGAGIKRMIKMQEAIKFQKNYPNQFSRIVNERFNSWKKEINAIQKKYPHISPKMMSDMSHKILVEFSDRPKRKQLEVLDELSNTTQKTILIIR